MSRAQKLLLFLSLLASAGVFVHTLLAPDGWGRRRRAAADLVTLDADIASETQRAAQLRRQINALKTRPDVQERVVRHELEYVKPNELVVDLGAATPAQPAK
jgi:cell division protein FtsB